MSSFSVVFFPNIFETDSKYINLTSRHTAEHFDVWSFDNSYLAFFYFKKPLFAGCLELTVMTSVEQSELLLLVSGMTVSCWCAGSL